MFLLHGAHHHPPFYQQTPKFLLMDDNVPPHGDEIVTVRLQEVGLPLMVWPAMTSDPMKHFWDQQLKLIYNYGFYHNLLKTQTKGVHYIL